MDNRELITEYIKALFKHWYVKVALVLEFLGIIVQPFINFIIPTWIYLAMFGAAFIVANYALYRSQKAEMSGLKADFEAREIRLREELNELRNKIPVLQLYFSTTQGQKKKVILTVSKAPQAPDFAKLVEEEESALEKLYAESEETSGSQGSKPFSGLIHRMERGEHKSREEYDKECRSYIKRYREYLRKRHNHEIYLARYRRVGFSIENTGVTPAENATVVIDFPDEFHFPVSDEDRSRLWQMRERPEAPARPRPFKPSLIETIQRGSVIPYIPPSSGWDSDSGAPPPNISGPTIRPKNSTEVTYSISNLMHNFAGELNPVEFYVKDEAIGHSWELVYSIHAANLPKPVEGSLLLEIQKR